MSMKPDMALDHFSDRLNCLICLQLQQRSEICILVIGHYETMKNAPS